MDNIEYYDKSIDLLKNEFSLWFLEGEKNEVQGENALPFVNCNFYEFS